MKNFTFSFGVKKRKFSASKKKNKKKIKISRAMIITLKWQTNQAPHKIKKNKEAFPTTTHLTLPQCKTLEWVAISCKLLVFTQQQQITKRWTLYSPQHRAGLYSTPLCNRHSISDSFLPSHCKKTKKKMASFRFSPPRSHPWFFPCVASVDKLSPFCLTSPAQYHTGREHREMSGCAVFSWSGL